MLSHLILPTKRKERCFLRKKSLNYSCVYNKDRYEIFHEGFLKKEVENKITISFSNQEVLIGGYSKNNLFEINIHFKSQEEVDSIILEIFYHLKAEGFNVKLNPVFKGALMKNETTGDKIIRLIDSVLEISGAFFRCQVGHRKVIYNEFHDLIVIPSGTAIANESESKNTTKEEMEIIDRKFKEMEEEGLISFRKSTKDIVRVTNITTLFSFSEENSLFIFKMFKLNEESIETIRRVDCRKEKERDLDSKLSEDERMRKIEMKNETKGNGIIYYENSSNGNIISFDGEKIVIELGEIKRKEEDKSKRNTTKSSEELVKLKNEREKYIDIMRDNGFIIDGKVQSFAIREIGLIGLILYGKSEVPDMHEYRTDDGERTLLQDKSIIGNMKRVKEIKC